MCLRPEATAKILEAEEIDLPGKSTCSHFYHLTSGIEKENIDRVGTPARYVRCVYMCDFYDHDYGSFSRALLSLSFSHYTLFLNASLFRSGTCFELRSAR